MSKTIVTLTMNPTIDESTVVDRVAPDTKLRCAPSRRDPGGGGINVSRLLKRLGGHSIAIYPVGGHTGEIFRELLDAEAIEQQPIPIQEMTRENLTVWDESSDQPYRFGMPGPTLSQAEQQACLAALGQIPHIDYLVASGSLPPGVPDDFYVQVAQIAKRTGAKLILDTSGDALTSTIQQVGAYLIKPNMRELGHLAGKRIDDEDEQEAIAQKFIREGKCEVMVISLGAAGALLVTAEQTERVRAPVVPIRSTVGAGDSMVAGIVFKLAQGDTIQKAVRYGVAAGAATVMAEGTSLADPANVEKLYKRQGL